MDRQIVEFSRRASNAVGLSIQYIITGLFSRLLTIVVGAFFGINVYRIFQAEMGIELLSLTMAIIAAFGVEAVGFMATHRAVKSYEDGKPMFIPLLFVAVYLLVSIGALMFADVSLAYRFVSVGIVILIGINYALIGMESVERNQARAVRADVARADTIAEEDREFARALEVQKQKDRQAVRMAKVSAPAKVVPPMPSSAVSNAVQSSDALSEAYRAHFVTLHGIGQEFTTAQAREVLSLSPKGTGNVLQSALTYKVLDRVGRGIYVPNGVDPNEL